jgi:small subunit ribosomal protein S8
MTDPIADMLTRIRNASAVKKAEIIMPMSKMKHKIALILKEEGWVYDVDIVKASTDPAKSAFDELKIVLKYKKSGRSAITSIKRISKPGLRAYSTKLELPRVLNNLGIAIVSTSKGLMTNKKARKEGLGGEVICEIY